MMAFMSPEVVTKKSEERLERLEEDEEEEEPAAATSVEVASVPAEEKEDGGEDEPLPTSFRPLWRTLRDRGWSYARGKGLVSWCWLKPGATVKCGVKGVDYFESERELMIHVLGRDAVPDEDDVESGKRRRVKAPERFEAVDFRSEDCALSDHGSDYGEEDEPRPRKRAAGEQPTAHQRPKRAKNAYAFYASHAVGLLKAAEPAAAHSELLKRAAAAWKVLPAQDKTQFVQMATEDKKRFDREMAAFAAATGIATHGAGGRGVAGLLCARIVIPTPLPSMSEEQRVLVARLEACLGTKLDAPQLKQILEALPLGKAVEELATEELSTVLEVALQKIDFSNHPLHYSAGTPKVDMARALGAVKYLVAARGRGLLL